MGLGSAKGRGLGAGPGAGVVTTGAGAGSGETSSARAGPVINTASARAMTGARYLGTARSFRYQGRKVSKSQRLAATRQAPTYWSGGWILTTVARKKARRAAAGEPGVGNQRHTTYDCPSVQVPLQTQ